MPLFYYNIHEEDRRLNIDLTGFVEIPKKTFEQIQRAVNRILGSDRINDKS